MPHKPLGPTTSHAWFQYQKGKNIPNIILFIALFAWLLTDRVLKLILSHVCQNQILRSDSIAYRPELWMCEWLSSDFVMQLKRDKILWWYFSGCEFKSQDCHRAVILSLSRTLNPHLVSWSDCIQPILWVTLGREGSMIQINKKKKRTGETETDPGNNVIIELSVNIDST